MRPQLSTAFVAVGAVLLIAAAAARVWLVTTGYFYWDDLILVGRASTTPIWSLDFLARNHDGHFMPAAFAVAGVSTLLAPLQWWLPAGTLVVLFVVAGGAVWRLLWLAAEAVPARGGAAAGVGTSARRQVITLAGLAFFLFSPMTVPSFAWWSAGLNTLPMQAALAWIAGDALLLCRSGAGQASGRDSRRRRTLIVVRSAVIFVVALAFFEKSLFIVPVVFGIAALYLRWRLPAQNVLGSHDDDRPAVPATPLTMVFLRARPLWAALTALAVVWAVIFLTVTDGLSGSHSPTQTLKLVWRSVNAAVVPGVVGGPWQWHRWNPSPPMADAPWWLIVAGWLALIVAVGVALRCRRGAAAVIACAAVYVVGAQLPVLWNRSGTFTALELAQTMRYLPDAALVIAVAGVLIAASPSKGDATHGRIPTLRPVAAATLAGAVVMALVASSLLSTVRFGDTWADNATRAYLTNARETFSQHPDQPMFDQAVPLEVLLPVTYPANQISHVFGRLPDGPRMVTSTSQLQVLDNSGRLVPGTVTPARRFDAGSGSCAHPEVRRPTRIALDGPLIDWRWTVGLSYCANQAGVAEISLPGGPPIRFLVDAGLHVVYVQLTGHGSALTVTPTSPGLALHTGAGRVGEVADARLIG